MIRHRVLLDLDEEEMRLLDTLTTPRRKSAFIGSLIRQAARAAESTAVSFGVLEQFEQRLARVERELEEAVHSKG